uniref:DUF2971 domain-containing protein n=1 Tax=Candidatus Kentrum sp. SD TaxID=2126332 RepID=A0A451BRQ8_9GAMM|nr:MAG: Protein of unknown function (DUF2971) [Candidatus Kentron sp. SD]
MSLSRSPEILSQWRAYAADGTGLALGFSETFLNSREIEPVSCQYESHESHAKSSVEKHLSLIEATYKAREKYQAVNEFTPWVRGNRERFYSLVQDLIAIKNPAFREEQEVRAIRCAKRGEVLTRVSEQVIIPYIEANFLKLACWYCSTKWGSSFLSGRADEKALSDVIPEIWLGPKSNDLNRKGISSLGPWIVNRYDCGYI